MMTTPSAITPQILALSERLGKGLVPEFVQVDTHSNAIENDCFIDVAKKCESNGGESVIGWQIWELPGILIEAEFHAVWRSPSGKLQDVSHKRNRETSILFVADPSRTYAGIRLDNVRVAICSEPLVHEFIRACENLHQAIVKQYGADYLGEVEVEEGDPLANLYDRKESLQAQISILFETKNSITNRF